MAEYVEFYKEWLPLPKNDFRILAMLAERGGSFKGSQADICRCLHIAPGQSKTNAKLQASIKILTSNGWITSRKQGNKYSLTLIPKEEMVSIDRVWVEDIIYVKGFENERVAWEPVLKMLIWVYGQDGLVIYTAEDIGEELAVSNDVVASAYKVLHYQFHSIMRDKATYKTFNGETRTAGQQFTGTFPWTRE